jgi:hypothetical protein
MLGSSRVAAQLAASQEGLSSMSEVNIYIYIYIYTTYKFFFLWYTPEDGPVRTKFVGVYERRKSSVYPLYRRLGRPQSRSARYGEEKYFLFPLGIEPRFLGRSALSQSLSLFHFEGYILL